MWTLFGVLVEVLVHLIHYKGKTFVLLWSEPWWLSFCHVQLCNCCYYQGLFTYESDWVSCLEAKSFPEVRLHCEWCFGLLKGGIIGKVYAGNFFFYVRSHVLNDFQWQVGVHLTIIGSMRDLGLVVEGKSDRHLSETMRQSFLVTTIVLFLLNPNILMQFQPIAWLLNKIHFLIIKLLIKLCPWLWIML